MDGKVVIITGASSGIGRASAFAFARRNAKVIIADVNVASGQHTVEQIKAQGGEASFVKTDVSKRADVEGLVKQTVEIYGRLDAAFNNAGIEGELAPTAECTDENWDRTLAINLKGLWLCMKYELIEMLKNKNGAIVNCSSVAGLVGFRNLPAYCASKGGIVQLTRTAALEYADSGIRINAVCPGVIKTSMIDRVTDNDPTVEEEFVALEPVARMGKPEEVAEAAVWLCSDQASFVTGHPMVVDGGFTAQ